MTTISDRLVVLLCHDRSGSGLFEDMLSKHPNVSVAGDLWNLQAFGERHPLSFHGYRKRQARRRPQSLVPHPPEMYTLLDGFFATVINRFAAPRVLVDIKYAHMPSVSEFWYSPAFGTLFLQYLGDRGIPLIHLHRRDVFAAIVSGHLAARRGVYGTRDSADLRPITLRLARTTLELQLAELANNIRIWRHYGGKLRALDICYEDLCRNLSHPATFFRPVERYLGLSSCDGYASDLVKTSPAPPTFIENYADLADLARAYGSID